MPTNQQLKEFQIQNNIICAICRRYTPTNLVENHHLTPASKGGKKKSTIKVCVDCGDQIHNLFTLNELRDDYNTLNKLLQHPKIQKWIKWVHKKPIGICMKRKKKR